MKKILSTISVLLILASTSFSQTFKQHYFSYSGLCSLQNVLNTTDAKGNKVAVYQCLNQSSSVSIYRINVINFKTVITDVNEYFSSLTKEYSNLGTPTETTLKGKKAVQLIENVNIEGHSMKQISLSTLHKNKAITLVLVTNSSSYNTLLTNFKNQFSFL